MPEVHKKKIKDLKKTEVLKICEQNETCLHCPLGFIGGFMIKSCAKDYCKDYVNKYDLDILEREVELK